MSVHCSEQGVGVFFCDDRQQLAFVGHVERIEAEKLAGGSNLDLYRHGIFLQHHADTGLTSDLVQRRRDTTARRVTQRADRRATGAHGGNQAVQRRGVRNDRSRETDAFA